ncbi:GDSL-type esterase/lipase family protein [Larkinella bovis]|uniref:GDSL-type esterase/lipase family protein n=1 Tax=Larkinella bovis TaxID=683041 RepID=A0ABW0IIZ3_9BACT
MKNRLSLFLLTFSLSTGVFAQQPVPFENEIKAFEQQDQTSPPPKKPILFTGSSSIKLWQSLKTDFPDKVVLNRGFGGSSLPDVIRFADRAIIPYKPKQIVIYVGENDVASGKVTAQAVLDRFVTLFTTIRKSLPRTPIVFISMKPSPSRRKYLPITQEANRLIKDYLAKQKRAQYLDIYSAMLDTNGQIRGELFRADSLHMAPKGYELWTAKLKPLLK